MSFLETLGGYAERKERREGEGPANPVVVGEDDEIEAVLAIPADDVPGAVRLSPERDECRCS